MNTCVVSGMSREVSLGNLAGLVCHYRRKTEKGKEDKFKNVSMCRWIVNGFDDQH